MTTDIALIEKREDLKLRLAAEEYKTLVDVFLAWVNRTIQKITRQPKPLPLWLMILFLSIVIDFIFWGAVYISGDFIIMSHISEIFGLGFGLGTLVLNSVSVIATTTIITINQSVHRVILLWRDNILDATESEKSLQDFEDWLKKACNLRLHLLAAILGGLFLSIFMVTSTKILIGVFPGYGSSIGMFIGCIFGGAFFYQVAIVMLLPWMLRRYELKLFVADPASSELLSQLSGELSFLVYIIAFYSALISLISVASRSSQITGVGIFVVLFLWLPIIAMFALNQTSLSSLVRRGKWKTLNEIQAKVEKLQTSENLEAKETTDAINRLLDYHERVSKTRNSALDFRAYLNFINSLLLPLLAFLLGNFDKVLSLFVR